MNILKKTMTTLCLSLIFLVSLNGNYAIANVKEIAQNNTKERTEIKEVKNYSIVNIVSKNGGKLAYYKHKKTGFNVVVFYPPNDGSCAMESETMSMYGLFIRNFAENNQGIAHLLEHVLVDPFQLFKKGNCFCFKSSSSKSTGGTMFTDMGVGFQLHGHMWSKELVDIYTSWFKDPKFLKDGGKSLESEKKRMIIELTQKNEDKFFKGVHSDYMHKTMDRFQNGKFQNSGFVEEIPKTKLLELEKQFRKIVVPSNMLMTISALNNPDYKEIMERFDEQYLSCFKGSTHSNLPKDFKKLVEKSPYRELKFDEDEIKENHVSLNNLKDYKIRGRVFWNLENLTPAQKDIFRLKRNYYDAFLESEIKKMGYSNVRINFNELTFCGFNSMTRDNMFVLDFYGNDPELFKKETLIKNAKKLNAKFFEKMKDMKEEFFANHVVHFGFAVFGTNCDFKNYRDNSLISGVLDSFSFTGDPLSPKYFDIENGEIKDDNLNATRIKENFRKYKNEFKVLFEKDPDYVDIFKFKSKEKSEALKDEKAKKDDKSEKDEKQEIVSEEYKNPVILDDIEKTNKNSASIANIKADLARDFLTYYVIGPKIVEKGWVYGDYWFFPSFKIPKENLSAVEAYMFKEFVKKLKEGKIKPSEREFFELKNAAMESCKGFFELRKSFANDCRGILKDEKKIREKAKISQNTAIDSIKSSKERLKVYEKRLKAELSKKNKNEEEIKKIKSFIEEEKRIIKTYEKSANDFNHCVKSKKDEFKGYITEHERLATYFQNYLQKLKTITYKDMLDYFKNNIKIEKGSKLEKYVEKEKKN